MAKISKITPLGSSTTYDIAAWSLKQQGRLTDANITHETDGSMVHFKASSSMTANKPMGDGNILHFHWDGNASNSWDAQLYIPDSHGSALQWRAHTNATTWGTGWHTVLDDQNYSTTCDTRYVKKSGDTMTGTLTVPKINLSRTTGTSYGRLQWYKDTYKTWTDYMSNNASGTCPSGGTPSTLGNVTTWAIRSYIESSSGYGWLWESAAESNTGTPTARMALSSYDGTLEVAGLVKITKNSNTTTIGSQNANFCHIYNSANIPFIFNNSVLTTGGNLGDSTYPFDNLTLGRSNGAGIYYKGTKSTYRMIRFIDNTNDTYGNGISIGGGGQTIIGGGESADTAAAQAGTAGAEIMQVCNDGDVQVISNLQDGWANRKVLTLNTNGYLMCPSYINVPTSNNENPTLSQFIVTNGSDNYYRKASAAHAMAAIRSNASGSWGINITGNAATATTATQAKAVLFGSTIGSSSTTHATALQNWFNSNKASTPRNQLIAFYDVSSGNGSLTFGYFLSGYDSNPYGGFYCAHYNTPYYIGIQNGTYTQSQIWKKGDAVTGAVWNDYAEYREATPDSTTPGYVVFENGDDTLSLTTERLQHFAGITSDTWGFAQGKTEKAKTPIAVSGRVLAYTYRDRNEYKPGDCVCAAPGGTIDIMTREEIREWPDRIVGTVSCVPEYDEWGGGELADRPSVKINGRIWVKVR